MVQLYEESMVFYNSPVFSLIKFAIGIYIIVLIVDVVLLLIQRGVGGNLREFTIGADLPRELIKKKSKLKNKWGKIRKRLENDNESEYKAAVIEADELVSDLIGRMGYGGKDAGEKIKNVPAGHLEAIEEIKEAHTLKNKIVLEEDFKLSREEAERALEKYEKFLHEFEVLN